MKVKINSYDNFNDNGVIEIKVDEEMFLYIRNELPKLAKYAINNENDYDKAFECLTSRDEMMKKWAEHIKTGKQNDGDNTSTD